MRCCFTHSPSATLISSGPLSRRSRLRRWAKAPRPLAQHQLPAFTIQRSQRRGAGALCTLHRRGQGSTDALATTARPDLPGRRGVCEKTAPTPPTRRASDRNTPRPTPRPRQTVSALRSATRQQTGNAARLCQRGVHLVADRRELWGALQYGQSGGGATIKVTDASSSGGRGTKSGFPSMSRCKTKQQRPSKLTGVKSR